MSVEKITARILQEAQDEAAALKAKAEAERDAMLQKAKDEAAMQTLTMQQKAQTDALLLKERRKSVAELEARKLHLSAKQEMIEAAFDEAAEQLVHMDQEEYKKFLLSLLAPYYKQVGEIVLNERDKKNLERKLMAELTESPMVVAEDTANIKGGFILRQGCVSINASVEKLLEQVKKDITVQIAETLFS